MSPRRETPDDAAEVRAVVAAAFGSDLEPGLLDALRRDPAWITSGWVTERDGVIVSHVAVVAVTVGGEPASALGIVSTHPDHQRHGHGTAAIWAAIQHLNAERERLVVVLGSPTYYGRFGFVPAPVVGVDHPEYPSPFLQALPLRTGHPRGAVEYPPPYADL